MARPHTAPAATIRKPSIDLAAIQDAIVGGHSPALKPTEIERKSEEQRTKVEQERLVRYKAAADLLDELDKRGIKMATHDGVAYTVMELLTATGSGRGKCFNAFETALNLTSLRLPDCFSTFVKWEIGGQDTDEYSPLRSMESLAVLHDRLRSVFVSDDLEDLLDAWFYPTAASRVVRKCQNEWERFWQVLIKVCRLLRKLMHHRLEASVLNSVERFIGFAIAGSATGSLQEFHTQMVAMDARARSAKLSPAEVEDAVRVLNEWWTIVVAAATEKGLTGPVPLWPPAPAGGEVDFQQQFNQLVEAGRIEEATDLLSDRFLPKNGSELSPHLACLLRAVQNTTPSLSDTGRWVGKLNQLLTAFSLQVHTDTHIAPQLRDTPGRNGKRCIQLAVSAGNGAFKSAKNLRVEPA